MNSEADHRSIRRRNQKLTYSIHAPSVRSYSVSPDRSQRSHRDTHHRGHSGDSYERDSVNYDERSHEDHHEGHHNEGHHQDRHHHNRHHHDRHQRDTHHHDSHHHNRHHHSSGSRDRSSSPDQQQINKYDPCVCGPDFYTNVLGPTPDETLLVGLQTFLGFCLGKAGEEDETHHEIEEEEQLSISSHQTQHKVEHNPHNEEYTLHNLEHSSHNAEHSLHNEEQSLHNTEHSSHNAGYPLHNPEPSLHTEHTEYTLQIHNPVEETETEDQFLENISQQPHSSPIHSVEEEISHEISLAENRAIEEVTESSPTEIEESISRVSRESQTIVHTGCHCRASCHCPQDSQSRVDKSSDTSESTISTGEMLNSEHSSQTDYPSLEHRTSQTSSEKRRHQKKACICKVIAEETTSAPCVPNSHCNCPTCCAKRRCKQSRRCKPVVPCSKTKSRCICSTASAGATAAAPKGCCCSATDISYSTEDDENNVVMKNGQVGLVKYAVTKITKFCSYTTFEIMKSTKKKPKVMPNTVEGVFVLKNSNET